MGSPSDARDRYLSTWDWAGVRIRWEILQRFDPETAVLLDVGAGWGKYRELLPEFVMDAVEIWQPYVEQERLRERYEFVWQCDVCSFDFESIDSYDAIILGDVFEHLSVEQATALLPRLLDACDELYVAVPFEYEQGIVDDNPYEVHQQADLNEAVMSWRYRHWLRPLDVSDDNTKAIYVSNREAV